jgi:hypothetical protein
MVDFFMDNDSLMDEAALTAAVFGAAEEEAREERELKREIAEETFEEFEEGERDSGTVSLDELKAMGEKRVYLHPDDPDAEPFIRWIDEVIAGRKGVEDDL